MRIGIDLGGTKIAGVALANSGQVLARQRVPTPQNYGDTVRAVADLVEELERVTDAVDSVSPVGVGIPGVVVPQTGLVKNANAIWLIGQPLGHDLEIRLNRPIRLANDANCFALSEAADGGGAGAPVVFGVILGTGVGAGIVIKGEVLVGANLIAGEWGHNPLPWPMDDERPGPACYCGKHGCIESWLSGPGFERDHWHRTGQKFSAREIVAAAERGEADAVASQARYHDRLARALASIVNVLDPNVIVLGGGMSNIPGLADATTAKLPQWVFSDALNTRVVRNVHGDASGVRGAAWLWPLDATV